MATVTNCLICSFVGLFIVQCAVILEGDRPFLRVPINHNATLKCCYKNTDVKSTLISIWVRRFRDGNETRGPYAVRSNLVRQNTTKNNTVCNTLTFKAVQLNDSGMYECYLNSSSISRYTHGTYLQVYKPLEKAINVSESTKNKILTAEGILLLLCVLVPGISLLHQSKNLNELEKKKVKKEEENIYQGLILDDCCTTYDQIERSHAQGPYQDVCNIKEEDEEIQLEKP